MTGVKYQAVTHCIFDMDGLLLDTEPLYSDAFNRITRRFGKEYKYEHKFKVMGFRTIDALSTIIKMLDLPLTPQEFEQELVPIYKEIFPACDLMPGVKRLLHHLSEQNIPFALATSSSTNSYELKSQRWKELFDLFSHKVFGSSDPEVKEGKPKPDIFLLTASRFPDKPEPSKCLVFEDSPNGVQAAKAAGMQVVMVPDPLLPKELQKDATVVLKSLEDFDPEMFGLPRFTT